MTDLKYQNYQAQMGAMIMDMRNTIVRYNTTLAGKMEMNSNWFFSALILLPADFKPITMGDYIH